MPIEIDVDALSLREEAETSFAQLNALLKEQAADLGRLQELHAQAEATRLATLLKAVIAHNRYCRSLLKQRLAADFMGWCPLRHKAVSIGTTVTEKCLYHIHRYLGEYDRPEAKYTVYILPVLDFEVGQQLSPPNYPARLVDEQWFFQQEDTGQAAGIWEPVSPKTEIIDMFNCRSNHMVECDPGLIELADEYGIPPRLVLRHQHNERFNERYLLEQTSQFPLKMREY